MSEMLPHRFRVSNLVCLVLSSVLWATCPPASVQAYITRPVTTLGHLCASTYITVVRVEKVSKEKGTIIYRKVRDLKGKYPKDLIKHVFDLKNTPQHKGPGEVPIRPDEKDWSYALQWAEPGKTAIMFTLKYDPYGDFGHTYIDGCWYATMCPPRDWEFWFSIYSDPTLLSRWHCGTPTQLVPALESILANKEAIVPVLVGGTREDLRLGRAKIQGMKVSLKIRDYNAKRDLVEGFVGKETNPPDSVVIKVAADISLAALDGDNLFAMADKDRLLRIDLRKREVTTVLRLPEDSVPHAIAAAGGQLFMVARGKESKFFIHVVDLAKARISRSVEWNSNEARFLGHMAKDRIYVLGRYLVGIVETATGQIEYIKIGGGLYHSAHRIDDRLYVARAYPGGLVIVDLAQKKVLNLHKTQDWLEQVRVVADQAFVVGQNNGIGKIDLKTGTYSQLAQPEKDSRGAHYNLHLGPDNQVLVLGQKQALYQYDVAGKLAATYPLPAQAFLGINGGWNGQAVLVGKNSVTLLKLPAKDAAPPHVKTLELKNAKVHQLPGDKGKGVTEGVVVVPEAGRGVESMTAVYVKALPDANNGLLTSKGKSCIFAAGPVLDNVWVVSAKSLVRRGQDLELTMVLADPQKGRRRESIPVRHFVYVPLQLPAGKYKLTTTWQFLDSIPDGKPTETKPLSFSCVFSQGEPESRKVAYHSVDLAGHPLVLFVKSGELKIRNVSIIGELGGKGHLSLNFNPGVFSGFGDSIYLADIIPKAWDVQLKPIAIQDPQNRQRELFEIAGAPIKGATLRLVVSPQPGDAPRLLVMDEKKADNILRVLTLETIPK